MGNAQGNLEVTIVDGRNLKDEDIVGKNDAYVEVYLDKNYKQRTKTVQNSNNPTWIEKFTL
jgi:Ca2+-dependent lipid-binding protein